MATYREQKNAIISENGYIPGIWSLIFSFLNIHKLGLKFQKFGSILLVLSYLLIVLSCGLESLGL